MLSALVVRSDGPRVDAIGRDLDNSTASVFGRSGKIVREQAVHSKRLHARNAVRLVDVGLDRADRIDDPRAGGEFAKENAGVIVERVEGKMPEVGSIGGRWLAGTSSDRNVDTVDASNLIDDHRTEHAGAAEYENRGHCWLSPKKQAGTHCCGPQGPPKILPNLLPRITKGSWSQIGGSIGEMTRN